MSDNLHPVADRNYILFSPDTTTVKVVENGSTKQRRDLSVGEMTGASF